MTSPCVGNCLRLTFSSDLEEAMFETGKSLSAISKFDSVLEKNQPIYIFMEDFENRALATSPCTPKIWKSFVDDAFTVIKKDQKEALLDPLNSIHNSIQFTSEDPSEDGSIPFLDMLVFPDEEGWLKTTVYRKPTHTNQYLHWDSHHAKPSK